MRLGVWTLAGAVLAAAAGADEAHFRLPAALAARVEVGARSGLAVGVESLGDLSLVSVSQAIRPFSLDPGLPLADPAACGDPDALFVPPGFAVPRGLQRTLTGETSGLTALHRVVVFVSRRIRLIEHDRGPQDAVSVLRRGLGRCSGRANLAVGLLRASGIPARTVHGVVVEAGAARWHRWGEAWLGELGWVPFDPGASVGAVSVRYLPLVGAGEHLGPPPVRLVALDESVFAELPRRDRLRVVPLGGATLVCTAPDAGLVTVVLVHSGGRRWYRSGRGDIEFAGVLPGRYRLWWRGEAGTGSLSLALVGGAPVRISLGQEQGGTP